MARRRAAQKRPLLPDPKHNSVQVAQFIRFIMHDGKLSVAEKMVYQALDMLKDKVKDMPAVEAFETALDKLKPLVEVKSRRVGGATYQVPVEVRPERARALAMRWLRDAARSRKEKLMSERLGNEIADILQERGSSMKKREDTHKMAEANKAFAHYRW